MMWERLSPGGAQVVRYAYMEEAREFGHRLVATRGPTPALVTSTSCWASAREVEWVDGRTEEVELIFTSSTGRPLHRSTFNDAFNRACEKGGVERQTGEGFHRLRHTYASLLIKQNVSPKKIQVRLGPLGHTSITETMDTYGHLYEDDDEAMRDAVETALAR